MRTAWGRVAATIAAVALTSLSTAACSGGSGDPEQEPTVPSPASASATAAATATASGAEESFRAWLAASRAPDADAACARLAPELVTRMLAELNATSPVKAKTCEEMITATAALHKATNQSADVDIDVQQETDTDATLFVTYASGDCGTVVMRRAAADWTITEQSQECAR